MFELIEKLRQKPDGAKKRIAFLMSFVFVGIIFVVWLSVVFPNFLQQKNIDDRVSAAEPSPFSTFTGIVSQGASSIGEQFSKIKNIGSSFFSGSDYYNLASTTLVASGAVGTTTNNQ
jgi:cytoskeletal protein RodZ